jgi:transcriptional regulator with GAF, ATPase, and Fis domain
MSAPSELLLALWRDVSRHLEISDFTTSAAELLCDRIAIENLAVRRLDADRRRIPIASQWPPDARRHDEPEISSAEWRRLERWVRQGQISHQASNVKTAKFPLQHLFVDIDADDLVVVPLNGEHGSRGILISFVQGRHFKRAHVDLIASLQEPFAVALDNDSRLHELASLREAAEAERQSLLRRLGRSEAGETIVGEDSGLAQVMERVTLVSRSEVPVLILGETGTGKELVARAIHNRSDRHNGPFLRVNCGAIPRELIDSQLFGHEKGSFTGASETRQGWFERADMGTLFLDEIGELPLDAQVRFLRVLQDGFVERVGGTKAIRVNVRVVAATHRDLAEMVRAGTFREDLWYRIAVFPILLPPLRDRLDDIPALARHFAERAAIRFGLAPVVPTDADIQLLQTYDWPGNIRELGAVIDRAAILGDGDTLELAAALGVTTPRGPLYSSGRISASAPALPTRGGTIAPLHAAMRAHIEAALRTTHGRVEGARGAARLLQINPHTLRARMRKLKIDWASFREPSFGENAGE